MKMSGIKIPATVEVFARFLLHMRSLLPLVCDHENNDRTLAGEEKLCEVPSETVPCSKSNWQLRKSCTEEFLAQYSSHRFMHSSRITSTSVKYIIKLSALNVSHLQCSIKLIDFYFSYRFACIGNGAILHW